MSVLSEKHAEDLARSGIAVEEAVQAGIQSRTASQVSEMVGFPVNSGGYLIPYPDTCPAAFRVRLDTPHRFTDGAEAKYLSRREAPVRLYVPTGVREELRTEPARRLIITEGEKKALSLRLHLGETVVGLPGVWAWRDSKRDQDGTTGVIEDLQNLAGLLKKRPVVIAFDSDARGNEHVVLAAFRLAEWIQRVAKGVPRWAIPEHGAGGEKVGIDDLHMKKGEQAVRELLDGALPPEEPFAFLLREKVASVSTSERRRFVGGPCYHDLRHLLEKCAPEQRSALAEEVRQGLGLSVQDRSALLGGLNCTPREPASPSQGAPLELKDPEPWPTPVEGARLLDDVMATIRRYVAVPPSAAEAATLWIVHTYCLDAFGVTPRLGITSPTKQCGKTRLLGLVARLARRPLACSNISTSALFRVLEEHHPTLLIDEADTFLQEREELRGVLNAGHTRTADTVIRTVGDDHEARVFRVWGAVAIALIGRLPDTLEDRSIVVDMQRRRAGEVVERLRCDREPLEFEVLRSQIAGWTRDALDLLRDAEPSVPEGLEDRASDNWRPLLAIADLAGGAWPDLARRAAVALCKRDDANERAGVLLLTDLRRFFEDQTPRDRATTEEVLAFLHGLEERPWGAWMAGKPIVARGFVKLLRPFKVTTKTIRVTTTQTAKGVLRTDLEEAWARYLPDTPSESATASHDRSAKDLGAMASVTDPTAVTGVERRNCLGDNDGYPVTDQHAGSASSRGVVWEEQRL